MYRKPTLPGILVFTIFLLVVPAGAQKRPKAKLDQDVSLPADFAIDYRLGIAQRGQIRGYSSLLEGTELNEAGAQVFTTFVQDQSISTLGLPYRWNFTIVNDGSVNAYSLPDGEVSVGSGLARLIGTNSGMWAAVLSHETAHVARRHAVRKYLYDLYVASQISYYEARVRAGDQNANWSLVGLRIAAPIARASVSRNLEHDADIQGMMLMAREGYHPDYVFALHHVLRVTTGDQSHFAAFFSSHPRWETRDQRDDRAYVDALVEYNRLWPDPDTSPGGRPPLVAFVGNPVAQENKRTKTADLVLPIYCRNAVEPLHVVILFRKDKRPVQAIDDEHRDDRGELAFRQDFECSEKNESIPLTLQLPASLVPPTERKFEAVADVYSSKGDFIEQFKPFVVTFPKP